VGWEPSYRTIVEYSINSSDAVTAVSHNLKQATLEKFKVTPEIRVIYNPIDTTVFHPRRTLSVASVCEGESLESESAELPQGSLPPERGNCPYILLHVSNFRAIKRVQDAVKILDLVRNSLPVRLVFLGDGPERQLAEKTARQLGVQDRVIFEGFVQNVEARLRQADLLLSTSGNESFGMSIAEAMASGIPVVAYGVGGIPEVVEDGVTGILVEFGAICDAARAVVQILSDPERHRQMGFEARQRIENKFRLELIATQYEELYREVLQEQLPVPVQSSPAR
jgi:N-acetyl-alpha-D-glucosaminyl L-malate synthase BshA